MCTKGGSITDIAFSPILTLPGDEDVFTSLGDFRFGFPGLLVVRVYSLGSGSGPDEIHIQLVFNLIASENVRYHVASISVHSCILRAIRQ